jgi:hypothetical protein
MGDLLLKPDLYFVLFASQLKRLRKNSRIRVNQKEKHPPGAKAQRLICCICGTTQVVPFQSNPPLSSFSQLLFLGSF